ncbi:MAG: hypothetical protein ACOX0A_01785 [Thermoguttaceae bacterium]|jgi:hypothetical protein
MIAEIFMMLFFILWSCLLCFIAVKGVKSYDKELMALREEQQRLQEKLEAIRRGEYKEEE